MKFETFLQSVAHKKMPEGLPLPLQSLWYDATGDWIMAHKIVDGPDGLVFARVHAYLHRKEGDLWNADYWYRKSGETRPEMTLKEEWEILVKRML
jgi:hypothetical protein